ncbi:MAG: hypothetical protein AAFO94_05590 [Bacteroidota bacterium]
MKFLATLLLGICTFLPFHVDAFDLTNFSAAFDVNQNVVLRWQTLSEKNNKVIEIQHSADGTHYRTISQVAGEGKANLSKNYQFTHQGVQGGRHFYRLRQITFSGEALFSATREVVVKKISNRIILIAANPMKGDIVQVRVTSNYDFIDFNLLDEAGAIIYRERVDKEQTEILIDMKKVNAGRYDFKLFVADRVLQKGQIELLK